MFGNQAHASDGGLFAPAGGSTRSLVAPAVAVSPCATAQPGIANSSTSTAPSAQGVSAFVLGSETGGQIGSKSASVPTAVPAPSPSVTSSRLKHRVRRRCGDAAAAAGASPFVGLAPATGASPFGGAATVASASLFGGQALSSTAGSGSKHAAGPSLFGSSSAAAADDSSLAATPTAIAFSLADDIRARILAIYQQADPSKVGELETLMTEYHNDEKALYHKVCAEYNVPPDPAAGQPPDAAAARKLGAADSAVVKAADLLASHGFWASEVAECHIRNKPYHKLLVYEELVSDGSQKVVAHLKAKDDPRGEPCWQGCLMLMEKNEPSWVDHEPSLADDFLSDFRTVFVI